MRILTKGAGLLGAGARTGGGMFSRTARKGKTTEPVGAAPVSARTDGKQAYEARRAAKAGVSLEKWMADKQRRARSELDAEQREKRKLQPPRPAGLLRRLLDKAHKPL